MIPGTAEMVKCRACLFDPLKVWTAAKMCEMHFDSSSGQACKKVAQLPLGTAALQCRNTKQYPQPLGRVLNTAVFHVAMIAYNGVHMGVVPEGFADGTFMPGDLRGAVRYLAISPVTHINITKSYMARGTRMNVVPRNI